MTTRLDDKQLRTLKGRNRPTIAQVADAAGVATATVSGILNKRADCYASEATRQRVRDTADRLGYRPNPVARGLAGKSTMTLGMVGAGFDVEPTARMFSGFESTARQAGNLIITSPTHNDSDIEDQTIRWMLDRFVDGMLVLPTETGKHTELKRLIDRGFPVVTFTGVGRLPFETPDVSTDNFAGGRVLGEHMIRIGRTKALMINSAHTCYVNEQKMAGVDAAFRDAGLKLPRRMHLPLKEYATRHWVVEEFTHMRQIIEANRGKIDALISVGDLLAMSAIRICTEIGLRVPEDVAVAGYDDCAFSSESAIPLTSISHDMEKVGRTAFELLQNQLSAKAEDKRPGQVKLPPTLRVRMSSSVKA